MKFNNKKLEKTSKLINIVIALVLCSFLIALSGKVIDDMDDWQETPTTDAFLDHAVISKKNMALKQLKDSISQKQERKSGILHTIKVVNDKYANAKQSYDNWIEARKTIGSPTEDKEVLSRANELDQFYQTQQAWQKTRFDIEQEISALEKARQMILDQIDEEHTSAYEMQRIARRKYDLKVFLTRLLFILPLLVLGIYFILKFRKHKYWPLFLGYILFSFYAFFFGLVPYLPSYGGYIRSTVGIVLSIVFGIYAINRIRTFVANKKRELETSTTERAKNVQIETAEKALDKHMCPSCGKDFLVKKWENNGVNTNKKDLYGAVTNFCRYCGIKLFKSCSNCNTKNYAHLPFCSNCGESIAAK